MRGIRPDIARPWANGFEQVLRKRSSHISMPTNGAKADGTGDEGQAGEGGSVRETGNAQLRVFSPMREPSLVAKDS